MLWRGFQMGRLMHSLITILPAFGKQFRSGNVTPASPILFVRLCIDVDSMSAALEQAGQLISIMLPVGACISCEVKPYWKIAEYFGIEFSL